MSLTKSEVLQVTGLSFNNITFDPKSVSGLKVWYDITDISAITFNTTTFAVSQINDKSGNSVNLTQATGANQPILNFSGGGRDMPYLPLDSTKSLSNATFVQAQPFTVYLVGKSNTFVDKTVFVSFNGSNTNGICQTLESTLNGVGGVANTAWVGSRNLYRTENALMRVMLNGAGTYCSVNNGLRVKTLTSPGTTSTSSIRIGGSTDFNFQELLIYSGSVSDNDDKKIVNYLSEKYALSGYNSLSIFGDSIGYGTNATTPELNGFASLTAAEKGLACYNFSIPSARVYGGATASIDFTTTINNMVYANIGWVVLMYGTNDIPAAGNTIWKPAYKSLIKKLIYYGYAPSKILLCTPPYQSNKANLVNVQTFCSQIASELGLTFVDMYAYTFANGGDTLLSDGTHPTTAGHRLMADYLKTFIS